MVCDQVLKDQRSAEQQLPAPDAALRTVTERGLETECSEEPAQVAVDAQQAEGAAGAGVRPSELAVDRRPSSWARRKRARLLSTQQQRPPTAAQGDSATQGAADAAPPVWGTPGRPCESGDGTQDGRCTAAGPALSAPPDGTASDGQHCRSADCEGSGDDNSQPEAGSGVPGWVDFFGKDPPPGWTCAPLEDWDFGSDDNGPADPICSRRAEEQALPEQSRCVNTASSPHQQPAASAAAPSNAQQDGDTQGKPHCQPEQRNRTTAGKPPPLRTPRGWRSPVDMLIPRAASLYCSGHRRRYGLPAARESQCRPSSCTRCCSDLLLRHTLLACSATRSFVAQCSPWLSRRCAEGDPQQGAAGPHPVRGHLPGQARRRVSAGRLATRGGAALSAAAGAGDPRQPAAAAAGDAWCVPRLQAVRSCLDTRTLHVDRT